MIVRYTLFNDDEFGNGALKRAHQISTILSKIDREVMSVSNYPKQYFGKNAFTRWNLGRDFYSFFGLKVLDRKKINKKAIDILSWKQWLKGLNEKEKNLIVVYELSFYADYTLIFACVQLGIKIIGLPHNLESLVYGQKSEINNKIAPNWFNQEIAILRLFTKIYVISREEYWLLSLYNIKVNYLPYQPSKKVVETCLEVRELRKLTSQNFYLSIGTAANLPTLEGFKELIFYFEEARIKEDLVIAGFYTERLDDYFTNISPNIKLKGALNSEELKFVLANCKAIIIYQKPTTGALTKIPELLLCGIPVVCNNAAARNFFNVKGVNVFNSKEELKTLLESKLDTCSKANIPFVDYKNFLKEF